MPRTSDINLDDGNMSFLFIGENGSHKTRFLGTFPEGFRVYVFDFDKGLASIRGAKNVEYDTFRDTAPKATPRPKEGLYPYGEAWTKFVDRFNALSKQINEAAGKGEKQPFDVYAIDSYTLASEALENRIALKTGKVNSESGAIAPIEIQDWQVFNRDMRNMVNTFIGWPGIKIVNAHVERATNPITGGMEQLPLANAKMQGLLPSFFDEVYFCDVKSEKDPKDATKMVQVPTLQTVKDAVRKNARSRWFVPQGTPTNWSSLIAAVKAGQSTKVTK